MAGFICGQCGFKQNIEPKYVSLAKACPKCRAVGRVQATNALPDTYSREDDDFLGDEKAGFSFLDLKYGRKTPTVSDLEGLKKDLESYFRLGIATNEQQLWLSQMDGLIRAAKADAAQQKAAEPPKKREPFTLEDLKLGARTPTNEEVNELKDELQYYVEEGIATSEQRLWLRRLQEGITTKNPRYEQKAATSESPAPHTAIPHFRFPCPDCGRFIRTKTAYAGMSANCPACGTGFTVPHPDTVRPHSDKTKPTPESTAAIKGDEYRRFITRAEELLPTLETVMKESISFLYSSSTFSLPASVQLQRDLTFMAVMVSEADGDFTETEMLIWSDIVTVFMGRSYLTFLDSTSTQRRAMSLKLPDAVASLKDPEVLQLPGWDWTLDGKCMSVQYLAHYDVWHGTAYAGQFIDFCEGFCDLLMRADRVVGTAEDEVVGRIKGWLDRSYQEARSDLPGGTPSEGVTTSKAPEESLSDLLAHLHALTGLATVKNEVDDLVAFLKVQGIRKDRGMAPASISRHLVFYGNPGTGKTTVARLLSKIYSSLGFLSKGHLVEADRSGMVAGFVGQTALKTREVCQQALGGVLFIDEAYTLVGKENDYGQEAIDTLLKFMEDSRDDLVVVVAGYPDKMAGFLNSNPGIRSRFTRFMNFQDYTPEELSSIFAGFCKDGGFTLAEEASQKACGIFEEQFLQRDETFGNARFARNLFEQCLVHHARRITKADHITDGMLTMLEREDVEWVG